MPGISMVNVLCCLLCFYAVTANELPSLPTTSSLTSAPRASEGQGRQGELRTQGLFPKLFGYLRNAFSPVVVSAGAVTPSSISSSTTELLESIQDDGDDYDARNSDYRALGLQMDNNFDEFQQNDVEEEPASGTEKGRDFETTTANGTDEWRGMPIYLFQGQYLAEPRLNRFVDGAMENLGQEIKSAALDPIYFKVLPKGRVASRPKPVRRIPVKPARRRSRRPVRRGIRRGQTFFTGRRLNFAEDHETDTGRQLQRRPATTAQAQSQKQQARNQVVGAGRVEGLSKVLRDGDAEMQLFGNYTLIRSHYNMGPLNLVMQFRTIRGMRRADANLERVKIHTVTRVNTQGCEMIDFLLDRPHPETIEIRGQLFPMAQRVAKNVFSRLFDGESFLVARIREKTGLALLSKKTSF